MPKDVKPASLVGVAEMDETYFLESYKGRKVVGRPPRKRGGRAAKRGLSREQIPVLVARDRSGATTDYVLSDTRKAAVMALLKPLLPTDAVVCSDGAGSISQATKELGLEHHAVLTSSGRHAVGAWHIQNVNAYHSRLKTWVRRFYGVATYYLENYLGWFRALDRMKEGRASARHALCQRHQAAVAARRADAGSNPAAHPAAWPAAGSAAAAPPGRRCTASAARGCGSFPTRPRHR